MAELKSTHIGKSDTQDYLSTLSDFSFELKVLKKFIDQPTLSETGLLQQVNLPFRNALRKLTWRDVIEKTNGGYRLAPPSWAGGCESGHSNDGNEWGIVALPFQSDNL